MTQDIQNTQTEQKADNQPLPAIETELYRMLELMVDFKAVVEKETAAIEAHDFKAMDGLQNIKHEYSRLYHGLVSDLYQRRDDVKNADPALRQRLIDTRESFHEALNINKDLLDRTQQSSKRLLDRILEAARKAAAEQQGQGYAQTGYKQTLDKNKAISMSLNEEL